ncbi:MAG TPA: ABC transporter, partial [Terriglobia bacterium]|nr:ABC transporter [Terriglobia bacterium]
DEKEKKHGKEARVVVVGDSDFASNSYFQQQRNGDVFLNAVSWLAEDEDLISVRPKSQENRSISLTRANSSVLFWMTMVLLPGSALISGILVWLRRR